MCANTWSPWSCGIVALVLFLGALFYWLDTLHYWLASYWGDVGATAAIGGLLFVVALFLALTASFQLKSRPKPVEPAPASNVLRDMLPDPVGIDVQAQPHCVDAGRRAVGLADGAFWIGRAQAAQIGLGKELPSCASF